MPKEIKDLIEVRAHLGTFDETHVVVFIIMKQFAPESAEEKVQVISKVLNPNVCTNAKSAIAELQMWKENIRRCTELGLHPPDLLLAYRAMESIFQQFSTKQNQC